MAQTDFTPGPWRAGGFSSIVGVPVMAQPDKTKNTFNVCGVAAPVSREENIANANLIAAAPELYRKLETAPCLPTTFDQYDRFASYYRAFLRERDELLARARGEVTP